MKNYAMKIVTLLVFVAATVQAEAQFSMSDYKQSAVGIYGGINLSNVNITSYSLGVDSKPGYQLGIYYRRGNEVYAQIGAEYQASDVRFSFHTAASDSVLQTNVRRGQLPVYIGGDLSQIFPGLPALRAFGGVIPYMNLQPGALTFSSSTLNRLGLNAAAGVGLDLSVLSIDAGYAMGLTDAIGGNFSSKGNYVFVDAGLKF